MHHELWKISPLHLVVVYDVFHSEYWIECFLWLACSLNVGSESAKPHTFSSSMWVNLHLPTSFTSTGMSNLKQLWDTKRTGSWVMELIQLKNWWRTSAISALSRGLPLYRSWPFDTKILWLCLTFFELVLHGEHKVKTILGLFQPASWRPQDVRLVGSSHCRAGLPRPRVGTCEDTFDGMTCKF